MRWHTLLPICGVAYLTASPVSPPDVPQNLSPPDTEVVGLKAIGKGKQIYSCKGGDQAQFEWVLEKPQADLLNQQGEIIGRHYEGPTWEATDGSKVSGEVQQRSKAPHGDAIPWLLLKAKTTSGTGTFGRVTYIQRVNTQGGVSPAGGCDKSHAGAEVSIDYQADYYFYIPRQ